MGSKINVLTLATKNLNKAENDIKVFPNPTQKFLTVSLAGESSVGKITILDLTGNVMIEDNLNNKQIDISNLVSGLYIVNIKTDKGVYRKKILKN
jgi:hypothetical protein